LSFLSTQLKPGMTPRAKALARAVELAEDTAARSTDPRHALDEAISAAFTACVAIIERERSIHDKRRATIREVQ
jgi:hypothetical protein